MQSSQYLLQSSKEYAIYICRHRAIPYVGDGLKHGQMLALWLLRNRTDKIKTFALSGLMAFERLYVHGEQSSNETIGLLAAPYKNNVPLIEGEGQFGNRVHPNAIGAPRYTDVKRTKAAEALLYRDLDIVPLKDNYDGSNKQPEHFLPLIPTVLLNGVSGIAIGWSTNILPHDLKALIEATRLALLDKPIPQIAPAYRGYDITVTSIGENRWEFAGRAKILDTSTVQITELPPGLDIESFRKRLIEMENNGQIQNFIDRSAEAIDITVKMLRGSIAEWTEQSAIDFFKLRERVTERIVVVDWDGNRIETYKNPENLIRDFAKWRLGWFTKRFEYLRNRDAYELRYWLALGRLFETNFPTKLGSFRNRATMQEDITGLLGEMFALDDTQLDRVMALPTYRWTQEFEIEVRKRIEDLKAILAEYDAILASPEKLRSIYLKELDELKNLKL